MAAGDEAVVQSLEWALGIITSLFVVALGYLHLRINAVDSRVTADHAELEGRMNNGQQEVRQSLDRVRAVMDQRDSNDREFRERVLERMATRDDLLTLTRSLRQMVRDITGQNHVGVSDDV
jgi:hypothetical protein